VVVAFSTPFPSFDIGGAWDEASDAGACGTAWPAQAELMGRRATPLFFGLQWNAAHDLPYRFSHISMMG